ncbi:response regulator [uncultured Phenylobacterium sp.]|uniref:response regulator n=1 Tax=uncultured Phenylobacterium sp. TaxID=349273 RepID=UPI0025CE3325|nr:response regulator [uncultured Phenylobacterium sp.]
MVEDEMLVALLLHDMLTDLGCLVVGPAASVAEALAMIETKPLDAAILDVNLEGQMSYPVADALIARSLPFVLSTGYASNRLQEGYRTLPALQKPYHATELREALASVLAPATPSADRKPAPRRPPLAA